MPVTPSAAPTILEVTVSETVTDLTLTSLSLHLTLPSFASLYKLMSFLPMLDVLPLPEVEADQSKVTGLTQLHPVHPLSLQQLPTARPLAKQRLT